MRVDWQNRLVDLADLCVRGMHMDQLLLWIRGLEQSVAVRRGLAEPGAKGQDHVRLRDHLAHVR